MKRSVPFSTKILRILVASVAGFCLLVGSLISITTGVGLYRNLATFARQNTLQAISDMNLYVQTAVSASRTVTDNENVVSALKSASPSPELDSAMTQFHLTTFSVYSAQLYDVKGNSYKTYGTEDLPSLEELKSHPFFAAFLESEKTEVYWLRHDCLPGIYNNNRYDESAGMYTFVTKVTDGAHTVGYFLMDFHPSRMLNSFFDHRSVSGYENNVSYLVSDGALLSASSTNGANTHDFLPPSPSSLTRKGHYLYVSEPLPSPDSALVVAVPLTHFYEDLFTVILISTACCVFCTVGAYLILRVTMKRTLKPLTDLATELKQTKR